jgi:hypothetical protein
MKEGSEWLFVLIVVFYERESQESGNICYEVLKWNPVIAS